MTGPRDTERRLREAAEACAERERLQRRRTDLRQLIDTGRAQLGQLHSRLSRETADVDALESLSLTTVLALIRRSHDNDLERERAEQRAAAYRLQESTERLETWVRELDIVAARLRRLDSADAELERAKDEHRHALIAAGSPHAERLEALTSEVARLAGERHELVEVIKAGNRARSDLEQAVAALSSAHDWSAYDTWLGGGVVASSVKHNRLDTAALHQRNAAASLRTFRQELADVGKDLPIDVDVSPTLRTLDVWFDNLFSDLAVGKRIATTRRSVIQALRQVDSALSALTLQEQRISAQVHALAGHRDQLLLEP